MGKSFRIIFFVFVFIFLFAKNTLATCSVSISPQQAIINSTRDFVFSVNNTGDSPIVFVKIPTGFNQNISVTNVSSSGWDLSLVSGGYGMVGGNIGAGSSANFNVSIGVGSEIGSIEWALDASEQADGGNAFACNTAAMEVVLETSEPTVEPTPTPTVVPVPSISNIAVSASDTTATITWSLDTAASGTVYYGTTNSYGSSVNTGAQGYEKVTLTGLSPSTTYHFQIQIVGVSGTTVVADNTFVTAAAGTVSTVTTTVTNVVTNTVISTVTNTNTVTKTIIDLVAPVLSVKGLDKKVWSSTPLISGTASDNRGVSWVEYRRKNIGQWRGVVIEGKAGAQKISWEVLPEISLDGTYVLEFRAVDVFGNKSKIQLVELVIDQIPPTVGGMVVYQNGMRMSSEQGVVYVASNTKGEINFYERGGSDRIVVKIGKEVVIASKILGSNSWVARFNLPAGRYETEFEAVDGAGRTSSKKGVVIVVMDSNQFLVGGVGKKVLVKTYFWDSEEKRFRTWSAETYGQKSNLETDNNGNFALILPKGEYYLEFGAGGQKVLTPTFKVERTEPLSLVAEVSKLPWWSRIVPMVAKVERKKVSVSEIASKINLAEMGVVGKPKIVLLMTPEMPETQEALVRFEEEAKKTNRDLMVIGVQADEQSLVSIIGQRKIEYKTDMMADWLGVTGSLVLPRAIWTDDFGNIEKTQETLY